MALSQKMRSLFCYFPPGLDEIEVDGKRAVQMKQMPYEFESIVWAWVNTMPTLEERKTYLIFDDRTLALTFDGWECFTKWMLETLRAAQASSGDE